jgi:transposase InsO family protein
VIGAIENAEGKAIVERIKNVAKLIFTDEEGNPRQYTWRTISTWYYRYKVNGVTDLITRKRKDCGKPRKTTPEELLEAINEALPHFRNGITPPKAAVYRFCVEKGILRREAIAPTTFYRLVKEYDLLDKSDNENTRRLAFAMAYANDLWQADTMFGPHVANTDGKKVQTKLIAFIDDASRVICHGQFFFNENIDALIESLKKAFYKRGVPRQIYVDNGSIYCSAELNLICARIGCILRHTAVRDGASKGKIERFFRHVRSSFLIRNLDLSSIDVLNTQLSEWIENKYNSQRHSVLGMAPIDRFAIDRKRITFLSPSDSTDELFYAEAQRKVKKDNTFSFKGIRYETPVELSGKAIVIRHCRSSISKSPVIYYKDQRMGEARVVDLIANGKLKRLGRSRKK